MKKSYVDDKNRKRRYYDYEEIDLKRYDKIVIYIRKRKIDRDFNFDKNFKYKRYDFFFERELFDEKEK